MHWTWLLGIFFGSVRSQGAPPEGSAFPEADLSAASAFIAEGGQPDALRGLPAAPPRGNVIPREQLVAYCDSQTNETPCQQAIDGMNSTFWQAGAEYPQRITINLLQSMKVNGVVMLPRQDDEGGLITDHQIELSSDAKNWVKVAYGTWWPDNDRKSSAFEAMEVRWVRLTALNGTGTAPAIAELQVTEAQSLIPPNPQKGAWGLSIDLPLVPVAGGVDPITGKVVMWSSFNYDTFMASPKGTTQTALWDPTAERVTHKSVTETVHDMFCPGISLDQEGRIIATGGADFKRISIYDSSNEKWIKGAPMIKARGYHASTTLSDGRIFMIGGSWSGGESINKWGEVYDPRTNTGLSLPKADARLMATNDIRYDRRDNHAWLFGWKGQSVFQAGPSKEMHWYLTEGQGDAQGAGVRTGDDDAMCGSAVMYDAYDGKIITFGGSPNYDSSTATETTTIITLPNGRENATVDKAPPMARPRTFHTSVVLPDGSVFTAGGQPVGIPFVESGAHFTPERFDTIGNKWQDWQPNSIPRVYHSISLLLQDGTVFNAGGGLCGSCSSNHFDGQIFTPPYLLDSQGNTKPRPKILTLEQSRVAPGAEVRLTTDKEVLTASLIRYGTATHAVATDQRRIPVPLDSPAGTRNSYKFKVPDDPGIAIPGYYMLFVMDGDGVPSISRNIQVVVS